MLSTNLQSNIIEFIPSVHTIDMYFSIVDSEKGYRIYKSIIPLEVLNTFELNDETDYIYTSFNTQVLGFTCFNLKLKDCKLSFVKRFHNFTIGQYFKDLGLIVNRNFINDVVIWIPSTEHNIDFNLFDKYTIKSQFRTITDGHELLVTYDGVSKVLKKTVNELSEVETESFGKVLQENEIFKYHDELDHKKIDNEKAHPILNLAIKRDLKIQVSPPDRNNKYKKFINKIVLFRDSYLNTEEFASIINIPNHSFIKLKSIKISSVRSESNQLIFADGFVEKDARQGIKKGPFNKSPYTKVHFFFIFHEDNTAQAASLNNYYKNGLGFFKGLESYTKVRYYTESNFSIKFSNKENPLQEIKAAIDAKNFKPDVEYFAIYLSPFDKHEADKNRRSIYYNVKKLLLQKSIHSQVVVANKMQLQEGTSFAYSMVNISIAALAKLGGTPWIIKSSLKNELVVGVGAFRNQDSGLQYVGSAFSFQNNGQFNEFDCFVRTDTAILAGAIQEAVVRFTNINRAPEKLIIHFYKDMNQKEINPILDKLNNLGLDIPVFIVTINKTESNDVIAWDMDSSNLMPMSGTFINVGSKEFLLFNNTRYDNNHNANDGYPFPVKIKITCTKSDLLTSNLVRELIDQVYQFSRMYWKSVKQQHLPVTIKYPEMVAEIFPHFNSLTLPEFGRDKLWFL